MRNSATADPFDTEQIRARVLDAWRASPDRLREDANSEEDFALGGYRDRLIVELSQNAADAARQSGDQCRILIRLTDTELVFANTGATIDGEGVRSLASLRASSKRSDGATTGRFGVGFAAVLAVSDDPAVVSTAGGVRFSADRSRELVADTDALADELRRRAGHVPVLRLPFPETTPPPKGYDTAVLLPFRDATARDIAIELVAAIDDALLLGLPSIVEIVVELGNGPRRVLRADRVDDIVHVSDGDDATRWRVLTSSGQLSADLLSDRPTEERLRPSWSVTWAIPVDDSGRPRPVPLRISSVLHAPTPSMEAVSFEALLLASFALDPSRQHVAAGPLTDFLITRCAGTYGDLVVALAEEIGPEALVLVPPPHVVGPFDGLLREAVRSDLRERRLLRAAADDTLLSRERAVVLLDGDDEVIAVLSDVVDGLVGKEWLASATVLALLEPRTLSIADVLDLLVDIQRPATWWHSLYESLGSVDRTQLDGLPVPLVDGRVARDVRACTLPTNNAELLTSLGLRVIHPDAAHPLLAKLGARSGEPRAVLADPRLHALLQEELPLDERARLSRSVLALASEASLQPGEEPGLGQLAVPLEGGEWVDVRGSVLPSSPLASVVADDVKTIDRAFVDDVGESALESVGALRSFRVESHHDVLLDPDGVDELVPDGAGWVEHVASVVETDEIGAAIAVELAVVTGLDLVADDAWERAWKMLTTADIRRAIVEPVRIVLGHGGQVSVPSFAAWWLSEAPVFGGISPSQVRLPGDDRLSELFEPLPSFAGPFDSSLLTAIGVCATVEELLSRPHGPADLLGRLAEAGSAPTAAAVQGIYAALASIDVDRWPEPPEMVRVIDGNATRVVPAADAVVVVAPHHFPLAERGVIVGSARLAEILDISTTAAAAAAVELVSGNERETPHPIRALLPNAPAHYVEHDDIVCGARSVDWWVDVDDVVHAATMDGLARGMAWVTDSWSRRWEVAAVIAEPGRLSEALAEQAFDASG